MQFTGELPGNPSEDLIQQIVGDRRSASLPWLEEQIGDALYYAVLRQSAWAIDLGILVPGAFRREAVRILADVRPEFASIVIEGENEAEI